MVQFRRGIGLTERSVAEYQAWMYRELAAQRSGITSRQRAFLGSLREAAVAYLQTFVNRT